jgi:hypothetical protein
MGILVLVLAPRAVEVPEEPAEVAAQDIDADHRLVRLRRSCLAA